jgi:hypothetical protein
MSRNFGCCLKHQPHTCINGPEPFHIVIGEDAGIGVREDAVLNAFPAHRLAIIKDCCITCFVEVLFKLRLFFRVFPEREEGLSAPQSCTIPEGV